MVLALDFICDTFRFRLILNSGVRSFNNLKPGWPLKNSRLRVSATTVVIGVTIVNLIPFRSRVFAYVCAFVYWVAANLLLVNFALDVKGNCFSCMFKLRK